MGRGADCQRAVGQARDPGLAENGRQVHAEATAGAAAWRSPVASPKANSICERVIGTIRRECLDWMIPLSEAHLRSILKSWVEHYNRGRPHSSLGPGVPDPPAILATVRKLESRHRLGEGVVVLAKSVLGGLHHEYSMAPGLSDRGFLGTSATDAANNCGAQSSPEQATGAAGNRPLGIHEIEAWRRAQHIALRGVVGVDRAYVAPISTLFIGMHAGNLVARKVVGPCAAAARKERHDVMAEVRAGCLLASSSNSTRAGGEKM